ncbi:MAG: TatD family hydrolase [Anaerolineae bacterium]|nr:TatD family hydrolase [Anaerolineae bacterium]
MIDSHCHVDFKRYAGDRAAVLARAADAGVVAIVNPSISLQNSAEVCALAAVEPLVYAGVGVHPNDAGNFDLSGIEELRALTEQPEVVAIGEIGLDYYWNKSPKEVQQRVLEAQLELAAALSLPVIIHNRESTADVLAILEAWVGGLPADHVLKTRPGVLHSFSGGPDDALRVMEAGFYVGITGPVTFEKADVLREVVRTVPADRLLIETDGPFLTPHPYRGKRNEPAYVQYVADRVASVRVSEVEAIARQTTANAIRLFALPLEMPAA